MDRATIAYVIIALMILIVPIIAMRVRYMSRDNRIKRERDRQGF